MVVFHNLDPNSPMLEERVAEVVMRSCAAPSYFPTYQNYVDGAMHSNDPG
jgi:patatin-like phospholipase/acyl hydrolase